MAATSSSESPKQVDGTAGKASFHESSGGSTAAAGAAGSPPSAAGGMKDPPPSAGNDEEFASAETTVIKPMVPTYESVENSELYQTALALMKEGEFEDCIELVEQGIDELKEELLVLLHPQSAADSSSVDVHPSMAPYYYLYGTTLLYKVEEQDLNGPDGGAAAGVVVTDGAVAAAPALPPSGGGVEEGDNGNDDEEEGNEYYQDAAAEAGGDVYGNEDDEGPEAEGAAVHDDDKVEDLQVAWEFLEAARGVLEKMIVATGEPGTDTDKRRCDLAQVRKREGDLNRMNGQNHAAAADYRASLDYLKDNAQIGPYDRKIADLHYNVGLAYTLEAAAAAAAAAATSSNPDPMVAALLPPAPPTKVLSGREKAALRCRGVYHYWQCCKVLAWQLATLCGVEDPNDVLERAERSVANLKSAGDGDSNNGGKDDGETADRSNEGDLAEHPAIVSRKLSKLRADLAMHVPDATGGDDDGQEQVALAAELLQLLEDIQETIDEAERSEEGVQKVTEMKAEITAAVASASAALGSGQGGGETDHGFGSAAAAATSAAAQPILAVKKKAKKRDASVADLKDHTDGFKRPAAE